MTEVFGVQCILHDVATVDWKSNYLWFCRMTHELREEGCHRMGVGFKL